MGSVFKTFTVAAGLDTGRADMNTLFDASQAFQIGDRKIKDFHAQNRVMTLEEVYLHSSNIGTSQLAVQMGPDVMRSYFQRLGLLDAARIELKESAKPVVPRRWDNSTLASLSFGYGIMITPAQMIQAMGALTNGGRMIPLSLRKGGARGVQPQQVVTEETSRTILDLMRRNVVKGSGGFADAPGLRVGGKTGSANKLVGGRYDPSHALGSFAAVFPVDGPLNGKRYAILIVMDEPGTYPKTGAYVAAPAVKNIADRIAGFLGVERREDRWRTAMGEKVPEYQDVAGTGCERASPVRPAAPRRGLRSRHHRRHRRQPQGRAPAPCSSPCRDRPPTAAPSFPRPWPRAPSPSWPPPTRPKPQPRSWSRPAMCAAPTPSPRGASTAPSPRPAWP